jgi:hypothetical protein
MTGLRLQFDGLQGWHLLPGEAVSGFDASVQCALVGLGTDKGSNLLVPDFGTDLLAAGLFGLLSDITNTQHLANFAAAETKEVINNNTEDGTEISNLYLQPEVFAPPFISFSASMVSTKRETRGIVLTAN